MLALLKVEISAFVVIESRLLMELYLMFPKSIYLAKYF